VEQVWKRVTVGPDTFEALSSEERISILKLLDTSRQLTGTDVANALGISKSSAFKQLNRLARAGLVERMDEGRKWIYYRNTSKAERLLHPEDVSIHLVLSAGLAAVMVGLLLLLALSPTLGPSLGASDGAAGNEPGLLVLGDPRVAGGDLVIEVFSGAAFLDDTQVVLLLADASVVASTPSGPSSEPTFVTTGHVRALSTGPAVTVLDIDGDGWIDAGDRIVVSGLAGDATVAVHGPSGACLASLPVSA
jgi:DNA-binding transcriptional ArsR family regulator